MATHQNVQPTSYIAGEDLSSYQFYAVRLSADKTVVRCNGELYRSCGILLNAPKINEAALVCEGGHCEAVLGDTVTVAGTYLRPDSTGALIPVATTYGACARADEAGSAAEKRRVFVFPEVAPPTSP